MFSTMIKGLYITSLLIFMSTFQHGGTTVLVKESSIHMCSRIERYIEEIVDKYNETFLEPYKVFCFNIPPRCTRYREVIREVNNTIFIPKTKLVYECCEGFVKKNGECSAICPFGCVHGKCVKPKSCMCDAGWQGPDCSVECPNGWYGEGCQMYCTCQNGATCDKKNGFCHCSPGFAGTFCENVCPPESHGKECENICRCQNGGVCKLMEGKCDCPPGYIGKYCQFQCEDETYGDKCLSNCSCNDQATIFCSHIDGKCFCVPGYKGDSCSKKCDLNTWGVLCSKKCTCPSNAVCDHVTGSCSCQPGWHGPLCDQKCTEGFFGKDCKKKCPDCMHMPGNCHYITGQCSCPPGSRGSNCDLECPENFFGENCNSECTCSNNSTCNSENGDCSCLSGWIGENCSIPCTNGMYGLNCSSFCNCSANCTCNPVDGECVCEDSDCLECSLNLSSEIQKGAAIIETGSSMDILIILLVGCVLMGLFLFFSFVLCVTKRAKKARLHLRKEETSTTNVMQENNSPSISSYHFMNPNYDTIGNTETPKETFERSFSSKNTFAEKQEGNKLDIEEEEFKFPDCETASPIRKQVVEILFHNDLTNIGAKNDSCIREIRYSKTAGSNSVDDQDTSSQTNSLYADVDYKNEGHSDIQNPTKIKEAEH